MILVNAIVLEKIQDYFELGVPAVFPRDLDLGPVRPPERGNLATVITGIRRCGKTYRLFQEMHRVIEEGYDPRNMLYFNFEDERLKPYTPQLLSDVIDSFYSLRPAARTEGAFIFFDEIQEVPEWGAFLRRLIDTYKITLYVTGSSSKMLSSSLATEFRGRALSRELFPMSFSEYVRFHGCALPERCEDGTLAVSSGRAGELRRLLESYLERGGFIATQDLVAPDAIMLLQEYAQRTVNMDVIERYDVRNQLVASQFLTRCLASSARELSLNKVVSTFKSAGMPTSRATLASLLAYYQEAYLVFQLDEFTRALASNARSVAKVYAVDPGMLMAFSPSATQDLAQRLETAVFNSLRREMPNMRKGALTRLLPVDAKGGRHEVDFVVGDPLMGTAQKLVQVTLGMENEKTARREIAGIEAGMRMFGNTEGWIVTMDEERDIELACGTVRIVPAWKWLLG